MLATRIFDELVMNEGLPGFFSDQFVYGFGVSSTKITFMLEVLLGNREDGKATWYQGVYHVFEALGREKVRAECPCACDNLEISLVGLG